MACSRTKTLLAFALVLVFVVALLHPSVTTALASIVALMGIWAAYAQGSQPPAEKFTGGTPLVSCGPACGDPCSGGGDSDSDSGSGSGSDSDSDSSDDGGLCVAGLEEDYGHADRAAGDNCRYARQGTNPVSANRVAYQPAGPACCPGAADDACIDGDERLAYQGTARNYSVRATTGVMRRYAAMHGYLAPVMAETERTAPWWGRGG